MSEKIFIFGQSRSGKSTLAAAIALYFFDKDGYDVRINPKNPAGTRYLIDKWIVPLRQGYFPPFTDEIVRRIDVGFEHRKTGERGGLTFFEIAGEKVRQIDRTRRDHSDLDPAVVKALNEASVILLVGATNPEPKDRYMLQVFLEELATRENMFKIPVGFVITKWDRVPVMESPEDFIKENYSEALGLLRAAFPKAEVFLFSVGEVVEEGDAPRLTVDFAAGVERIVEWIRKVAGEP